MEILLVGINSKYTHSNLATRCLAYYTKCSNVHVYESNINVDIKKTLHDILSYNCEVIGFSVYIFNIDYVQKLISDIKLICPKVQIITGGPQPCDGDLRIDGEGEKAFKNFVTGSNEQGYIELDELFGMYDEDYINSLQGRTLYYEASRGCPFSCAYCLSGLNEKLRYKSLDIIKKELIFFDSMKVQQIKFVDRTFNANQKFCNDILNVILDEDISCKFHFEMAGDLFTDDMLDIISKFPIGQLEFEIGIQSFNLQTLSAATRKSDLDKVRNNIRKIMKKGNCHLHVDLIAGLPLENFESFKQSFNSCYSLQSHYIQVGFLKVLANSRLQKTADEYSIKHSCYAPYEVLSTAHISNRELYEIKYVEDAVSKFYNCQGFANTLQYLITKYISPFDFYLALGKHISKHSTLAHIKKYELLIEMFGNEIIDLLRFDFLLTHDTQNLPTALFMNYDDESRIINKNKRVCCIKLNIFGEQKTVLFNRNSKHAITGEYEYKFI